MPLQRADCCAQQPVHTSKLLYLIILEWYGKVAWVHDNVAFCSKLLQFFSTWEAKQRLQEEMVPMHSAMYASFWHPLGSFMGLLTCVQTFAWSTCTHTVYICPHMPEMLQIYTCTWCKICFMPDRTCILASSPLYSFLNWCPKFSSLLTGLVLQSTNLYLCVEMWLQIDSSLV